MVPHCYAMPLNLYPPLVPFPFLRLPQYYGSYRSFESFLLSPAVPGSVFVGLRSPAELVHFYHLLDVPAELLDQAFQAEDLKHLKFVNWALRSLTTPERFDGVVLAVKKFGKIAQNPYLRAIRRVF